MCVFVPQMSVCTPLLGRLNVKSPHHDLQPVRDQDRGGAVDGGASQEGAGKRRVRRRGKRRGE
jgi:hypothetical protein